MKDYDFNTIEIVKEGWSRIDGVKAQFVAGFAIYVVVAMVVQTLLSIIFPQGTPEAPNLLNQQIVGILSYPVLMPIMAGIIMMAVEHSRGDSINYNSIFSYFFMTGKLALAGVAIYALTVIGLLLFILPGIYLSVAYIFTIPLIIDKNMEVFEAMELSRKMVTKYWFKVAGVVGLLSVIMFISAIPLGVGLIWSIPLMFVTLYGLVYPIIFSED